MSLIMKAPDYWLSHYITSTDPAQIQRSLGRARFTSGGEFFELAHFLRDGRPRRHGGPPGRGHVLEPARRLREIGAFPVHQAGVSRRDGRAVHLGDRPVPGDVVEPPGPGPGNPQTVPVPGNSLRQRMLGSRCTAAASRSTSLRGRPTAAVTSVTSGPPLVRVPVLSITTAGNPGGCLQRQRVS